MNEKVLPLLKARLGISTGVKDPVLNAIIDGITADCKNTHGLVLGETRPDHVLFVLDWATWKYQHPEEEAMPRSIQFRLKNMIIKKEAGGNEQSDMG